jgi:leader peptidase (prepilin peptidase)/N-methyltransferase
MHMSTHTVWTILGWAITGLALNPVVQRVGGPQGLPQLAKAGRVAITTALATSTLFGLLAWRFGAGLELVAFSALALFGVRLALVDLVELRLPTALIMPLYPVTLGLLGLAAAAEGSYVDLFRAVSGMVVLPMTYLALALLSRGGIGTGDVRLAGPVGLVLGWESWTAVLAGTVIAFIYASIAILVIAANGQANRSTPVPFGPAMLAGVFTFVIVPWSV